MIYEDCKLLGLLVRTTDYVERPEPKIIQPKIWFFKINVKKKTTHNNNIKIKSIDSSLCIE